MKNKIIIVLGILVSCFSVALMAFDLSDPHGKGIHLDFVSFLAVIAALGMLPAFFKILNIVKERRKKMFELIAQKKGRLTAFELSKALNIPINKATHILNDMCSDGFANTGVTDQGNTVYFVNGVISEEEKSTALSPSNQTKSKTLNC